MNIQSMYKLFLLKNFQYAKLILQFKILQEYNENFTIYIL